MLRMNHFKNNRVSSAKIDLGWECSTNFGISFTLTRNNNGPITDPCSNA